MQMNITFRHVDPIESLKTYAQEKVERVNKYLDTASEAHVVLSVEKHHHQADITIHSGRYMLRGKERSQDMYASIDLAMDKIERQLKRYKERLKEKHGRDRVHHRLDLVDQMKWRHQIFESAADEASDQSPKIIKKNEFLARPMSVEEAIMQMDLLGANFFVYLDADTHAVSVVFRRADSSVDLIKTPSSAGQKQ